MAGFKSKKIFCMDMSRLSKKPCQAKGFPTNSFNEHGFQIYKCRFHGGASTGPKTPEGRQRCAEAKTTHGHETRQARTDRAAAMRNLRELEDLGHALGIMYGPRMRGRKPHMIS